MSGQGWLVSPRFDLALLVGPCLGAAALAVALPVALPEGAAAPAWFYLALVLLIDVAHVYASLWRTYFDPEERARRPALLTLTPLACLAAAGLVHSLAPGLFWTAMAYLAVFHFARQAMGFTMLYRARAGLPMGGLGALVERWLAYGLVGFPLLWWHAHLPRAFSWFMPGDFLPGLPLWVLPPAAAVLAALALTHLALRLRERALTPGRDLWLLGVAAVWFGGVVFTNADLPFTLSNVVAHGVPYFALVAWTVHRKWALEGRGPGRAGWFSGLGLLAFLLPLVALAFVEEGLWDVFVWGDNAWLFGAWDVEAAATHWLVPLLSVPQLTHYVLDGFIWRTAEAENPGLRRWIFGASEA